MRVINKILRQQIFSNSLSLFWVLILMLGIVVLDAAAPWPFKILIDNVLNSQPLETTPLFQHILGRFNSRDLLGFFAVFMYFTSTFLLVIFEYLRSTQTKVVIKRVTANFSRKAFKNLQSLAIGFYRDQKIGDYIYRLSYDVSALGELLEHGVLPLITSSLYLLVTVSVMLFISVKLTLLALIALPFLATGLYTFNASIAYVTKKSENYNSSSLSFIEEALSHLKVIQAFSQENNQSRTFNEKMETSLVTENSLYRLDFLLTLLVGVIIAVSYSIIILYGIRSVFSGTLTTGLLIVFIFYLDNLTNPILSVIYSVIDIRESYVKVSRLQDFFTPKTQLNYHIGHIRKITEPAVIFSNVTLAGDKGTKILHNVSFTIEANKRTVIFGVSGSGKSSIVNLILRFIDKPTSGDIFIGPYHIQDYDLRTLRNSIAYVPQEITLFDGSIKKNIFFGNSHATIKDIKRAARLAAADEFIHRLPGKYNFDVGESGNYLSGGQRQRIMLARALMKTDAPILLFDETLSALDVKTRTQVLNNIYEFSQDKTTIIISNIFAVVSAADNVIVLNKGKLVYSGPSSRLPREISLYKMITNSDEDSTST